MTKKSPLIKPNLEDGFIQINLKKLNKKQQTKKLAQFKKQIAILNRLLKKQLFTLFTTFVIQKKFFIDIKIYNKNFQIYYFYNYFKYNTFVYKIKKIFKNNENLKNVKNSKKHKIMFFTS